MEREPLNRAMRADQYWQHNAAAPGSTLYYATQFLAQWERTGVRAVYGFLREIEDVAGDCADPNVARAKFSWWRQDLAQLFAGRPSHPALRALADYIGPAALTEELFRAIIEAAETSLPPGRLLTWASLEAYLAGSAGSAGGLAARVLGLSQAPALEQAREISIAIGLARVVLNSGQDLRHGRLLIPLV